MIDRWVQILAYSENASTGDRVITVIFKDFPKLLQAELRTHRSARIQDTSNQSHYSSRAIPIEKALKQVQEKPFIFELTAFAKGMNGNKLDSEIRKQAEKEILELRDVAVGKVKRLMDLGIAKQDANRYLEPWMIGDCIITFSQQALEHFLGLRTKDGVQPDMRKYALDLQEQLKQKEPVPLLEGMWHLPFMDQWVDEDLTMDQKLKISAARCARISYKNFDGNFSHESDFILFERLVEGRHVTPLEHQAMVLKDSDQCYTLKGFASQRFLLENDLLY